MDIRRDGALALNFIDGKTSWASVGGFRMRTREPNGSGRKRALGIVFRLILSCGSPAYGQLPKRVIVESKTRTISPVP